MISASIAALERIFSPPFRTVLWKSLALTIALLALAWLALDNLIVGFAVGAPGWLATMISFATGLGLVFVLAYLISPVSAIVAGFFLDELAEQVEAETGAVGRALPPTAAMWIGVRFAALSFAVNIVALMVFLIPGVNAAVFIVANAYLFGREYFSFAALRFRPPAEVEALRRRHALYLFVSGFPIALMAAIPLVNLLTPMFAVAYMTRLHAKLETKSAAFGQAS